MSIPLKPDDPAYFLLRRGLEDPSCRSSPTVYLETCYICRDPEFALMGLPLCYACSKCGGHVPADDCTCDACGADQDPGPEEDTKTP